MSDTPRKIMRDFDAYTRKEHFEEFTIKLGGEPVVFNDPSELDFRTLDSLDDPERFIKHCVSDESRSHFRAQKVPVHMFREIMRDYMEHYKVDELLSGN